MHASELQILRAARGACMSSGGAGGRGRDFCFFLRKDTYELDLDSSRNTTHESARAKEPGLQLANSAENRAVYTHTHCATAANEALQFRGETQSGEPVSGERYN